MDELSIEMMGQTYTVSTVKLNLADIRMFFDLFARPANRPSPPAASVRGHQSKCCAKEGPLSIDGFADTVDCPGSEMGI